MATPTEPRRKTENVTRVGPQLLIDDPATVLHDSILRGRTPRRNLLALRATGSRTGATRVRFKNEEERQAYQQALAQMGDR